MNEEWHHMFGPTGEPAMEATKANTVPPTPPPTTTPAAPHPLGSKDSLTSTPTKQATSGMDTGGSGSSVGRRQQQQQRRTDSPNPFESRTKEKPSASSKKKGSPPRDEGHNMCKFFLISTKWNIFCALFFIFSMFRQVCSVQD